MNYSIKLLRLTTQILIAQSVFSKSVKSQKNLKLSLEDAKLSKKVVSQSDLDTRSLLDDVYYTQQDVASYKEGVSLYEKSVYDGDAYAQYYLGFCYEHGKGVKQDHQKAVEWYIKAAKQKEKTAFEHLIFLASKGYANAQFGLSDMFYTGEGVTQNYQKALIWVMKAADQGYVLAQHNLGNMFFNGIGVDQNYIKAVEWYLKAANQEYAAAQYNLGHMYYHGNGVKQDYQTAIEWVIKAANQMHLGAQFNLGRMYYFGEGVDQNYQEAFKWFLKAGHQGHVAAQHTLWTMYYYGNGVKQDYINAAKWIIKVANQGDSNAQYILGHMYYHGKGVDQNYQKAVEWFEKAANQGEKKALEKLTKLKDERYAQIYLILLSSMFTLFGIIGFCIFFSRYLKKNQSNSQKDYSSPIAEKSVVQQVDGKTFRKDELNQYQVKGAIPTVFHVSKTKTSKEVNVSEDPRKIFLKGLLDMKFDGLKKINMFLDDSILSPEANNEKRLFFYIIDKVDDKAFQKFVKAFAYDNGIGIKAIQKKDNYLKFRKKMLDVINSYSDEKCKEKVAGIKELLNYDDDFLQWLLDNQHYIVIHDYKLSNKIISRFEDVNSWGVWCMQYALVGNDNDTEYVNDNKKCLSHVGKTSSELSSRQCSKRSEDSPSYTVHNQTTTKALDSQSSHDKDSIIQNVQALYDDILTWIEDRMAIELDNASSADIALTNNDSEEYIRQNVLVRFKEFAEKNNLDITAPETLKQIKAKVFGNRSSIGFNVIFDYLKTVVPKKIALSYFETVSIDLADVSDFYGLIHGQYNVLKSDILNFSNSVEDIAYVVVPNAIFKELELSFKFKTNNSLSINCEKKSGEVPHWEISGDGDGQKGNSHRIYMNEFSFNDKKYWLVTHYLKVHPRTKREYGSIKTQQVRAVRILTDSLKIIK